MKLRSLGLFGGVAHESGAIQEVVFCAVQGAPRRMMRLFNAQALDLFPE